MPIKYVNKECITADRMLISFCNMVDDEFDGDLCAEYVTELGYHSVLFSYESFQFGVSYEMIYEYNHFGRLPRLARKTARLFMIRIKRGIK